MTAAMRDALAFGEATAVSTLEAPEGGGGVPSHGVATAEGT